MARIKEVSLSKGVSLNTSGYDYWKCNVSLTAELDVTDNHDDVLSDLSREIDARLEKESEGIL